jgi:dihydroxyacid dehydratase/phosphogluconate dehydratase
VTSTRPWLGWLVSGACSNVCNVRALFSTDANGRYEGNPYVHLILCKFIIKLLFRCNGHLLGLGQRIKKSIVEADLIGYQFGAVGVSDGISMGTKGMSYSLQSRDLIADQVETAAGGHWLDGMVVVPGCDKNMPGVLMACLWCS